MYITSDLFGGTPLHNRGETTTSTYWATMTESPHTVCLGKRRRNEDEDAQPSSYASRSINCLYNQTDSLQARPPTTNIARPAYPSPQHVTQPRPPLLRLLPAINVLYLGPPTRQTNEALQSEGHTRQVNLTPHGH
jgi:hypothetical protein